MKLKKNFFEKLLNVIFWYAKTDELPKSLCALFWLIVIGLITFVPLSVLMFVYLTINFWFETFGIQWVLNKIYYHLTKLIRKGKGTLLEKMLTNKYFIIFFSISYPIIYIYYREEILALPFLLKIAIVFTAFTASIILIFIIMVLFLNGLLFITPKVSKKFPKTTENLSNFVAVFFEKYCPKIDWK